MSRSGAPRARLPTCSNRYGADELGAAVDEALARGVPHPNAVRLALERRREAPPPLGVPLPAHLKTRDVTVRAHPLAGYDRLLEDDHDGRLNRCSRAPVRCNCTGW